MIEYAKLYDVKNPTRGTELSAGIDFFVPEFSSEFIKRFKEKNPLCGYTNKFIFVKNHERILIPSGLKVKLPLNTALIAFNKSGIATKTGLIVGACVVDQDYQGEVFISLINTTSSNINITYGQKIVQFILTPILFNNLVEKSEEELYSNITERGSGGFGSTGV